MSRAKGNFVKSKKFKHVQFSNKTREIEVEYTSKKKYSVHYGQLGIQKNILRAWVDQETKGKSVGFEFADGTVDYMPYDQPLALNKDPDYLLQDQIERLVLKLNETIKKKGISKKYIAKKLETSENQIFRLLNPSILNKNLEQLYQIAFILNKQIEIELKDAA
jgi:hypothetical protein